MRNGARTRRVPDQALFNNFSGRQPEWKPRTVLVSSAAEMP